MAGITYRIDSPDRLEWKGIGWVEFFEFEEAIWIMDVFSEKKGSGNALARKFLNYAKSKNKDIYGQANPQDNSHALDLNRLKKWYYSFGSEPIHMDGHPHAIKMEIRKWRKSEQRQKAEKQVPVRVR
jgi:hypothetical protein